MASPQAEHGHLRIATEIVEQLARIILSAYEWAVLWCIWRLTWAWQKKSDVVPVSRIAAITGLRKQHVSRAKRTLLEKRLLIEDRGRIRFNKDYEEWEVRRREVTNLGYSVTSTGDARVTNLGESVTNLGYKTSPLQEPQKKQKQLFKNKSRRKTQKPMCAPGSFDRFWTAYPKKVAKQAALKAWAKLNPSADLIETILAALEEHKQTEQWQKDGGRFVCHAGTWLNGRRWEDQVEPANVAAVTGCAPTDEAEARRALGWPENQP